MRRFEDKVVLITGAATGSGRASAERLAEEGASLLLADVQAQELDVTRIPHQGQGAEFYFSPDGKTLIGNAKLEGDETHYVYTMSVADGEMVKINDKGEDACSHFFPDGKRLIWTSTRDLTDLPKGGYSDPNN